MQDEIRRLRLESLSLGEDIGAIDRNQTVAPDRLLITTTTKNTYPTTANAFYFCTAQAITGTPTEGGTATINALSFNLYAYNLGTTIPPVGTQRVAHLTCGTYCFTYCC